MYLIRIRTDKAEFLFLTKIIPTSVSPLSLFKVYAGMFDSLRKLLGEEQIISIEKLSRVPDYLNYPKFKGVDSVDYYLYVNIPDDVKMAIVSSSGTSVIYREKKDVPEIKTIMLDWW